MQHRLFQKGDLDNFTFSHSPSWDKLKCRIPIIQALGLQKFLWLPKNVTTPKYSYLQTLLVKHAIDAWYIVKLLKHGHIWRLIGEFLESCTPYQNHHHLLMVVTGSQQGKTRWPHRVKLMSNINYTLTAKWSSHIYFGIKQYALAQGIHPL